MSSIQDFYSNQTIFITGATGFVGKLVVEKLLRSCPDLKKIYLLVRTKKGKTLDQRFDDIFSGACFDGLKSENPNFLKKISLMSGDVSQPVLGLSPESIEILKNEVNTIIHSAANVRFNIDLRTATFTNVRSVRDILDLMKEMKKVKAFVYVSTAFSHCLRNKIDEEFYDVDVNPEKILEMMELMDDRILELVAKPLLGVWPNTYVFTKALAEEVIRNYKTTLPVAIVRPSIVTSSVKEPLPGWIDNFQGLAGVTLGTCLGVLKTIHLDVKATSNMIPVDFVVNGIIASAWSTQKKSNEENSAIVPIYNIVPYKDNTVNWGWNIEYFKTFTFVYPLSAAVWYQYLQTSRFKTIHKIRAFFYHTLLAYLADSILFIAGKKPLAVKKFKKINKLLDLLSYFTTNSWHFESEKAQLLWESLDEKEKEVFDFNTKRLNWKQYIHSVILGGREYLMNDPLEAVPKAKKKMHLLRVVHYVVVGLVFYLWYLVISFVLRQIF